MCFRRQFLGKIWPIQLSFLPFGVLSSLTPRKTQFLTRSVKMIFPILLQSHILKVSRYLRSILLSIKDQQPTNLCSKHSPALQTLFFLWSFGPTRAMASSFMRFLDHTQQRITVGRTPLDEWSACRRDLYLTTHNTHNRQISTPPVGFEPTISAGERPQTHASDRAANAAKATNTLLQQN